MTEEKTSLMVSRRGLLGGLGATALLPNLARAAGPDFPPGFVWGASTSALQIEGATSEDGRGVSIWERFADRPGMIRDGSRPDIACDHYHRWPEDVALMKGAGFGAYRFSIAWPRVLPDGAGALNEAGLDFYKRLIDGLLEAQIRPMACLYHWDLPQTLQDRGGWMNRDCASWFADYAARMASRLGDRVGDWFALNEPSVVALFGHGTGEHAPGLAGGKQGALAALHHQNLGQGLALRALRAERAAFVLGTVLSLQPVHPCRDRDADRAAALRWDALWNRQALDGVMRGQLPDVLAADLAPFVKASDLETIRFPIDRLGVNYYAPLFIEHQPGNILDAGFGAAPPPEAGRTAMGWPVIPTGISQILRELKDLYGNPAVLVTENGAAYDDRPGDDGMVQDDARIAYLKDHLREIAKAIREGCRVDGYLVWSLLDNWEWQMGYAKRFGLVRVDYESLRRIPKQSFAWYRGVIRSGRL